MNEKIPTIRVTHKGRVNLRDFFTKTGELSEDQRDILFKTCVELPSYIHTKKSHQTTIGIGDKNFNILIENNNKLLLDKILEKLL